MVTSNASSFMLFISKASKSFQMAGELTKNNSLVLAQKLAKIGLVIATASITIFVPLLFEISREGQMIETEKVQVKDFRNQGCKFFFGSYLYINLTLLFPTLLFLLSLLTDYVIFLCTIPIQILIASYRKWVSVKRAYSGLLGFYSYIYKKFIVVKMKRLISCKINIC